MTGKMGAVAVGERTWANWAIARMADVDAMRLRGEATVPTSIGLERATNPFMRATSIEQLAERRAAKDSFRG